MTPPSTLPNATVDRYGTNATVNDAPTALAATDATVSTMSSTTDIAAIDEMIRAKFDAATITRVIGQPLLTSV